MSKHQSIKEEADALYPVAVQINDLMRTLNERGRITVVTQMLASLLRGYPQGDERLRIMTIILKGIAKMNGN